MNEKFERAAPTVARLLLMMVAFLATGATADVQRATDPRVADLVSRFARRSG